MEAQSLIDLLNCIKQLVEPMITIITTISENK